MEPFELKERWVRSLPGRLRIEVYGLKGNPLISKKIEARFSHLTGIHQVRACEDTGRMLIIYNEKQALIEQVYQQIQLVEQELYMQLHPDTRYEKEEAYIQEIAAASAESATLPIPEPLSVIPKLTESKTTAPPVLVTASIVGLGVLGAKQIFMGKTALARSPALFHVAGALSIVSGFPFLKRGFERLSKEGALSADLVLGTAALALALVRENLLALAGVSLIQFLYWQRSKQQIKNEDPSLYLSEQTKAYADRTSKWAFGLTGLTYAVTRNPMMSMGVLLASNPRPCLAAEEYNWKQAESMMQDRGMVVPANCRINQLRDLDTFVIEDTSLVFSKKENGISCVTHQEEEEKIWCYAGNLLSKSNHPLRLQIMTKAKETGRTKRTPFKVTESNEGIVGEIGGSEICFGTKAFMQLHRIDCHEFELIAKRHQRAGCEVYFLAKSGKCLGLIFNQCPSHLNSVGSQLVKLQRDLPQINVVFLSDSLHIQEQGLKRYQWTMFTGGYNEDHGLQNALFITKQTHLSSTVPTLHVKDLQHLESSIRLAQRIEALNTKHRRINQGWNLLGTGMVMAGRLTAPFANLLSDALKLFMLSSANKLSQFEQKPALQKEAGKSMTTDWHSLTEEEIVNKLISDRQRGLQEEQVQEIRYRVGQNLIHPPTKTHWITSFLRQFKEFTTLILLGTATISILSGDWFDGIAMTTVLLANAAISVVQERKAGRVVEALNQFQPPMTKVIRDGQEKELSATELVPGDIVVLEAGDRIPADIRLITDYSLEVNEAALTGESLAIQKRTCINPIETSLAERSNMLYMGTNVTRGKGIGIVVQTGMNTELGYLTSLLKDEEQQLTPLQQKVTSISKKFVKGAVLAGSIVFLIGLLRGNTIPQMVSTSVALIASAIPEGLPVTITIALSAGIYRMAKRKAVIRKLSALETLGRVTVICSDKTGTLTKNEMTVTDIASVEHQWNVTGEGYGPTGSITLKDGQDLESKELKKIIQIGLLCNNSQLVQENDVWTIKGDPTEGALLSLGAKAELDSFQVNTWNRVHEIPFDSFHGTMSVVCHDEGKQDQCYLMSKGSIEAVLKKCEFYQQNGEVIPLTEDVRQMILRQNEQFAERALRVLGFAYAPLQPGVDVREVTPSLIYVGMVGMIDPAKKEVKQAISDAFALGVKPVMITGDHPITAIAIGRQLGMYTEGDRVITGTDLEQLTNHQLTQLVGNVSIFARVSPEHKLRIVQAYQAAGHIVAMTGDGVNDAPAIKKADVGIAMGQTGTEVTKQTADMVLKEDHFGAIVDGVKESRTITSNIRKAIGCLLTGNLAEIIVSGLAVIAGLPIPLVPVQILLMNLLTDALPATVLAVNPGNKELITERQEIVDKPLYQKVAIRGLVLGLGSLALFAGSLAMGAPLPVARTMAFGTLVAGQLMQTFSWRQENGQHFKNWIKDKFFLGALGISWGALLAVMYVPAIAAFFHTAPLQIHQLALVMTVGGSVSMLAQPMIRLLSKQRSAVPKLQPNLAA
ncbi:HAD-IC family P-type ATPase [Brevibacillus sp. SYSU BS000544]|uniref:cation-translocating P-type ATPase n=1 Tax=Brevibacillus sp. SYSU BS000544 TaxID=3416443 RepID=UPI003CE56613